ncbi:NnrU family protein [Celeribacter indicus]|uniref:NnrU family protein n=1 Tax=Celeribacter indicus TaxID=1208324 RepID=A0A0B5E8D5_9RHOB|nr:NnrU family protein [Celeribacter indicus]AJE48582.1 NnrU family protein [Celeribacter indicus]SDX08983.1 NnrU protein [Celeribacter indicus]
MPILILGVLIWAGAHLFARLAPASRERLGRRGKGAVALALLLAVVLMVVGFRASPLLPVWEPPAFLRHLNNLMVLVAIYMMSPAPAKGVVLNRLRHPMLLGFALWALAHLLVNGDLASIVLFGGLLLWALVEIAAIDRAEPQWAGRPRGTFGKDAMFLVASIVLYGVIGVVHGWVGPSPFPM